MQTWPRTLIALVLALTSLSAITERVREPGVTDTEIRIGNIMPYTGPLAAFATSDGRKPPISTWSTSAAASTGAR